MRPSATSRFPRQARLVPRRGFLLQSGPQNIIAFLFNHLFKTQAPGILQAINNGLQEEIIQLKKECKENCRKFVDKCPNMSPVQYQAISIQLDRAVSELLQESVLQYGGSKKKNSIRFTDFLSNKMLIISTIREGVPYYLFELIKQITPFTEENWADFLALSTKSLQRYKQTEKRFKPLQSEKIIALAEVTHMGENVFGNISAFKLWLETPNYALGKAKPITFLHDAYGKELIMAELHRINHGILV